MTQHAHELLKQIIEESRLKDYPDLAADKYFEIFAAQEVIKECRFDLDPDEIASGVIGGSDDGGVDGFYLFANRRLIREDTDTLIFKGQQLNIEVVVVQAKNKAGFEESVPSKFKDFVDQCLRFGAPAASAQTLYSDSLLEAVSKFHALYKDALTLQPTLAIRFFHVSHADDVHVKVKERGTLLCQRTKEVFPTASCDYLPVTGSQLIKLFHRRPESTIPLTVSKQFDWNSFDRSAYMCVVRLADFYSFITDGDELRPGLFEANVRDHARDVKVNKGIQVTLQEPQNDDFWWLNNGITIIAGHAQLAAGALHIKNPLIVNGLQTSYELFAHFKKGGNKEDKRAIMVKVIVNEVEETSDRIISATNSQTAIATISLHATEQIHRSIEVSLRGKGLFYDRRKNFYRNQGKPVGAIVTIQQLAQAVAAIVLQQPDQARARPGTIAEKSYSQIFAESYPIGIYASCINTVRRADKYILEHEESRSARVNLLFYLAMYLPCAHLQSVKPDRKKIAAFDVSAVPDELVGSCYTWLSKTFVELGGDDNAAKGPKLLEALKVKILSDYKKQ